VPNRNVIAVVDDDQGFREALTGLLKSYGYVAIAFDSGDAFLNSDRRRETTCLISDVHMPQMTGPELHSRLIASGEPIPTILITAYPESEGRAGALQNGVVCYLTKPFREDDLLACINRVAHAPDSIRREGAGEDV
jgi:FixJ family two-component response regulator